MRPLPVGTIGRGRFLCANKQSRKTYETGGVDINKKERRP